MADLTQEMGHLSITDIYKALKTDLRRIIVPKPWMKGWEINIIKDILLHLKPKQCLEWGVGDSTFFFKKYLPKNATWITVEHDRNWAKQMKRPLLFHRLFQQNSRIEIVCVPPNHYPWTDSFNDGSYDDLKDYIQYPDIYKHFEFILVDGRARKECLIKAFELIGDKGIVILHDAGREYYHEPLTLYQHNVLLIDRQEDTAGLWLGSKGIDVESLLNLVQRQNDGDKGLFLRR